jgi:alpha-2-macroglobulin
LPDNTVESLLDPIREARFNTLSAALAILALEAMDPADGSVPGLAMESVDGGRHAIGESTGRLVRAEFDAATRRLWVEPADATPAWYVLNESGFDVTAPEAVQDRGLEVQRDYLDADGQPTTSVAVGGELTVRLRLRARGARAWQYVAVSDLLPGGFELVLDTPASASPARQDTDTEEPAGADVPVVPTLARPGSSFMPQHAEMREDRVVLYGTVQPQMQEFRYRIRAGSVGEFAIPPVHAESMYRQDVLARGGPGQRMIVLPADEE